jgi:hypothetical protein
MDDGESSSDYYSLGQQVSLTIGTSLAAALSIAGSTAIVYVICVDHRRKKASHNVKNRLLLGLCLSDILNSLVYVFWALAIPEGTPSGKLRSSLRFLYLCLWPMLQSHNSKNKLFRRILLLQNSNKIY